MTDRTQLAERYTITRCKSCKAQVSWEQREPVVLLIDEIDRADEEFEAFLSFGWFHPFPEEGCQFGQYLGDAQVEEIVVEPVE